jgi:hypothetical protein
MAHDLFGETKKMTTDKLELLIEDPEKVLEEEDDDNDIEKEDDENDILGLEYEQFQKYLHE